MNARVSYSFQRFPYGARYGACPARSRGNPKISLWLSVDPLAGEYPSVSPYVYTVSNPINFFDPDGKIPLPLIVNFTRISSKYGIRFHPIRKRWLGHGGIDLAVKTGTLVRAAAHGTVAHIGYDPKGYGRYIVIKHDKGYYTLYAHLQKEVLVKKGQKVLNGESIAFSGNTGGSTGPHLHFEIIKANKLSDVFKRKNKIDPEGIYDLQLEIYGTIGPFEEDYYKFKEKTRIPFINSNPNLTQTQKIGRTRKKISPVLIDKIDLKPLKINVFNQVKYD